MQEFLVVSAIGEDKPGIINALSQVATESGCNILDTRMTVLGGEFALLMMLNGAEAAIIKASDQFPAVADRFGLTTILKRTQPRRADQIGFYRHVPCGFWWYTNCRRQCPNSI